MKRLVNKPELYRYYSLDRALLIFLLEQLQVHNRTDEELRDTVRKYPMVCVPATNNDAYCTDVIIQDLADKFRNYTMDEQDLGDDPNVCPSVDSLMQAGAGFRVVTQPFFTHADR